MLQWAGYAMCAGLLAGVLVHPWTPDETVQRLLHLTSFATATALNVSTMPPFITVKERGSK